MKTVIRAALAALLTAGALATANPALPAAAAQSESSVPLHDAVARLRVAQEDRTGYNRETSYGGWIDADKDGCNTRAEVLLEEATTAPTITGRCTLTGGSWHSLYDGLDFTNASDLDIDHLVSVPATQKRAGAAGHLISGTPPTSAANGFTAASDPAQQLDDLTVAARGSMDGYSRDKFPHWINQGDNCDTREVVLKRDGTNVKTGSDCYPTSGTWKSPYDGATWTNPSDVDIDHMVPLGN